jgi:hypothetical protein
MKYSKSLKFKIMTVSFLSLCLLLLSCARHVQETSFAKADAKHYMLIASDSSDFKDGVRNRIVDKYRETAHIDIVNISQLKSIHADKYNVVVIMDSCWGWSHLNLSFKKYIEGLESKEHVILFITTGGRDWDYQYKNVDAITSASVIENEQEVFELLSQRIDGVLLKAENRTR